MKVFYPQNVFLRVIQEINENQLTEKDDSKFHGFRIISRIFRIASIVVVLLGSFPKVTKEKQLRGFLFLVVACHSVEIRHYYNKSEQLEQKKHTLKERLLTITMKRLFF